MDYKKRRRELNLSVSTVANYVGVGISTVRVWENGGIRGMRIGSLKKYAEILKINPVEIVDPDRQSKDSKTIDMITESLRYLDRDKIERVFGFTLAQLDNSDDYYDD